MPQHPPARTGEEKRTSIGVLCTVLAVVLLLFVALLNSSDSAARKNIARYELRDALPRPPTRALPAHSVAFLLLYTATTSSHPHALRHTCRKSVRMWNHVGICVA